MNLWGFIIPVQGAFFYMTAYLASKYKFKAPDIIYVYFYQFLLSLFISGLVGLMFIISQGIHNIIFISLCLLLFLNPLIIYLTGKILGPREFKWQLLNKISAQTNYILSNIHVLNNNIGLLAVMTLFSLASTFSFAFWGYTLAQLWGMDVNLFSLLILAFMTRILMLIKFTPGNLGATQLFAGFIFQLIHAKVSDIVSISLFQSLSTLILAFTIGIIVSVLNFRFMPLSRLRSVFLPANLKGI